MTPKYISGVQLSVLDVAYLSKAGWYKVNMNMGRNLSMTRGKGCEFARKSCYEYMKSKDYNRSAIYPYCLQADITKWMCTSDNKHVGHCSGGVTTGVRGPFQLQLSSADQFVGDHYAEYCPMVIPSKVDGDTSLLTMTQLIGAAATNQTNAELSCKVL